MHISLYSEPPGSLVTPLDLAYTSAAELPENYKTNEPDPYGAGLFAEILAESLRETEGENTLNPDDSAADDVLLAENNKILIKNETDREDIPVMEQKKAAGFEKTNLITKTDEKNISEDELDIAACSELNQNILISAESLLNRPEKQKAADNSPMPHTQEDEDAEVSAEEFRAFQQSGVSELVVSSAHAGKEKADGEEQVNQKAAAGEKIAGKGKIRNDDDNAQPASGRPAEEVAVWAKNSENKKTPGRLEEVRGRERRGERLSIEVRDLRSGQTGTETRSDVRINAGLEKPPASESGARELVMELRLPDQVQKAPGPDTSWGTRSAHAFEDLLARELHQNFNNDIVRHASMILRDEGKGMIRLALKPDNLGNVKICLEMAENKITGQIIVESEEALRAFQREIHSLEQAFKESGFQDANLEMSLAANSSGAEEFEQEAQARTLLSLFAAATRYDSGEQAEGFFTGTFERGQTTINLLV